MCRCAAPRRSARGRRHGAGAPSTSRHRPALDRPAAVHDRDAVRDLGDDAHVVRHEQDADAALVGEPRMSAQDLRLDRDVERRRGLVGDDELRIAGQRRGDDDALALAAGELVRIGREPPLRLRNADRLQQLQRPAPAPAAATGRDGGAWSRRAGSRP